MRLPDSDAGIVFAGCIEILNELATTNKSAYEIGREYGISSPDRAVKTIWGNKDKYREAAINDPDNQWTIEF